MERLKKEISPKDRTPFREELIDITEHGFNSSLRTFENDPDKIVREISFGRFLGNYETGSGVEAAIMGKKLLEELRDKYHFPIPITHIVIGKDEGPYLYNPCVYVITEKVEGEKIYDALENREMSQEERGRIIDSLDKTFAQFTRYARDKYEHKDFFLWDMGGIRQFMWGTTKEDTEKNLYMVDTDINYVTREQDMILKYYRFDFSRMMSLENAYHVTLERTREEIAKLEKVTHCTFLPAQRRI